MAEPEFQKGTGPDAMSQGEAGQLNAALSTVPAANPMDRLEGIEWADGTEGDYAPQNEDEEVLLSQTPGLGAGRPDDIKTGPVPKSLIRALPLLRRAAASPDAPDHLVAAVRMLEYRLARDARRMES